MSTRYIYNGFGQYEEKDGQKGIGMFFGGREFWLPYEKVTAIPNTILREVDHDKSTPERGQMAELTYMLVPVSGEEIANFFTDSGLPETGAEMGIIQIKGRKTGNVITVNSGFDAEGKVMTTDVAEVEATEEEKTLAASRAKAYKEKKVSEYFQSKRERMTGHQGRSTPEPIRKLYMEELGVVDNDDITAHAKPVAPVTNISPELLQTIFNLAQGSKENFEEAIKNAVQKVEDAGEEAAKKAVKILTNVNAGRSILQK